VSVARIHAGPPAATGIRRHQVGEIVSLAVDPGLFGGEPLHIPAEWIDSVTEEAVHLTVDAATARRGRR